MTGRYSYSLTGSLLHDHVVFSFAYDARGLKLQPVSISPSAAYESLMPPLPRLTGKCTNGQEVAFDIPADAAPRWDGVAFWLPAEAQLLPAKRGRKWVMPMMVLCCLVFVVAAWNIGSYVLDLHHARQASQELREVYHAQETAPMASTAAPAAATAAPTASPVPDASATPLTSLPRVPYPQNPHAVATEKFRKLRRQNDDIVGWLTIDGLLDEAVVQKDNSYYLRRDYRGYHNVNGAIFLDERVALAPSRPYTLHLYGHNMKTGAMFGCLRNYENLKFYKKNPFITFDTLYEDGRYVIFAVSTVSTIRQNRHYFDFIGIDSANLARRQTAIDQLTRNSLIYTGMDVRPDDQILLLITCVDDLTERRVVAARRLRPNETEKALLQSIQ